MIEQKIIDYLNNVLARATAYGDIPTPMPDTFVTVEKTGSYELNHIRTATLAIQSWSSSRFEAAELNEEVKTAMHNAVYLDFISRSHCETDYNFTDTTTNRHRYQAVFEVVYY